MPVFVCDDSKGATRGSAEIQDAEIPGRQSLVGSVRLASPPRSRQGTSILMDHQYQPPALTEASDMLLDFRVI